MCPRKDQNLRRYWVGHACFWVAWDSHSLTTCLRVRCNWYASLSEVLGMYRWRLSTIMVVWMTCSLWRVDLCGKRIGESHRKHEPTYLSSKHFVAAGCDQWHLLRIGFIRPHAWWISLRALCTTVSCPKWYPKGLRRYWVCVVHWKSARTPRRCLGGKLLSVSAWATMQLLSKLTFNPTWLRAASKDGSRDVAWAQFLKVRRMSSTKSKSQMGLNTGVCPAASHCAVTLPMLWSRVLANSPAEWLPPWGVPLEICIAHSSLKKVKRKRCSISSFIKRCASKAAREGMVARKAATLAWLRLSKAPRMSSFTKMGVAAETSTMDTM